MSKVTFWLLVDRSESSLRSDRQLILNPLTDQLNGDFTLTELTNETFKKIFSVFLEVIP